MIKEIKEINEIEYREILCKYFPLYNESDRVIVMKRTNLIIDYHSHKNLIDNNNCALSINFDYSNKITYLLFIKIPKEHRGKGYGKILYDITERVAGMLGSEYVEQTPSGKTWTGESRMSYLLRNGYEKVNDDDDTVRKKIIY